MKLGAIIDLMAISRSKIEFIFLATLSNVTQRRIELVCHCKEIRSSPAQFLHLDYEQVKMKQDSQGQE